MVKVTEDKVQLWLQKGWLMQESETKLLEGLVAEHPYYKKGQILLARAYKNTGNIAFEVQLQKAALCTKDREWLYEFIHQTNDHNMSVDSVDQQSKSREKVKNQKVAESNITDLKEESEILLQEEKIEEPETEPALKIDIKQGEGKVQKVNEEENLQAIEPKLKVKVQVEERAPDAPIDKGSEKKNKVDSEETIQISSKKEDEFRKEKLPEGSASKELSFLDWLDYSQNELKESPKDKEEQLEEQSDLEIKEKPTSNISEAEEMLSKFLSNKPKPGEVKLNSYDPEEKSIQSDSAEFIPVSETLAKVYLEQNELEMARKVYEKLILKFPQKKAYFAALIQELDNKN